MPRLSAATRLALAAVLAGPLAASAQDLTAVPLTALALEPSSVAVEASSAVLPPVEDASRRPLARVAVLAAAVVPAAATGVLWGYADGTQNEWRWSNVHDGPGSPREAELNQRWHAYAAGARVMLAVDLGAALGIGAAARPDWQETAALASTSTVALLLSHHLAHNVQQGKSLLYFGQVAPTDRLANRIGPVPIAVASVAATGAVLYLAYRILD